MLLLVRVKMYGLNLTSFTSVDKIMIGCTNWHTCLQFQTFSKKFRTCVSPFFSFPICSSNQSTMFSSLPLLLKSFKNLTVVKTNIVMSIILIIYKSIFSGSTIILIYDSDSISAGVVNVPIDNTRPEH